MFTDSEVILMRTSCLSSANHSKRQKKKMHKNTIFTLVATIAFRYSHNYRRNEIFGSFLGVIPKTAAVSPRKCRNEPTKFFIVIKVRFSIKKNKKKQTILLY